MTGNNTQEKLTSRERERERERESILADLELARQKQEGKITWESWETESGLTNWVKELEQKLLKFDDEAIEEEIVETSSSTPSDTENSHTPLNKKSNMTKKIFIVIKSKTTEREGIGNNQALLKLEPATQFRGKQVEEILLKDISKLREWARDEKGDENLWGWELHSRNDNWPNDRVVKIEINNYSWGDNDRLIIEDQLEADQISSTKLEKKKISFSCGDRLDLIPGNTGASNWEIKISRINLKLKRLPFVIEEVRINNLDEETYRSINDLIGKIKRDENKKIVIESQNLSEREIRYSWEELVDYKFYYLSLKGEDIKIEETEVEKTEIIDGEDRIIKEKKIVPKNIKIIEDDGIEDETENESEDTKEFFEEIPSETEENIKVGVIKFHKETGDYRAFSNFYLLEKLDLDGKIISDEETIITYGLPAKLTKTGKETSDEKICGNNIFLWKSSEAIFQALKFDNENDIQKIKDADEDRNIDEVRRLGSPREELKMRDNFQDEEGNELTWDDYRQRAMRFAIRSKFANSRASEKLDDLLLKTGNAILIEDTRNEANSYSDSYWGNDSPDAPNNFDKSATSKKEWYENNPDARHGENWLGRILMERRSILRIERILENESEEIRKEFERRKFLDYENATPENWEEMIIREIDKATENYWDESKTQAIGEKISDLEEELEEDIAEIKKEQNEGAESLFNSFKNKIEEAKRNLNGSAIADNFETEMKNLINEVENNIFDPKEELAEAREEENDEKIKEIEDNFATFADGSHRLKLTEEEKQKNDKFLGNFNSIVSEWDEKVWGKRSQIKLDEIDDDRIPNLLENEEEENYWERIKNPSSEDKRNVTKKKKFIAAIRKRKLWKIILSTFDDSLSDRKEDWEIVLNEETEKIKKNILESGAKFIKNKERRFNFTNYLVFNFYKKALFLLSENAYQPGHSLLTSTAEKIGEELEGYFPNNYSTLPENEKQALRKETEKLLSETWRTIFFATKIPSDILILKEEQSPFWSFLSPKDDEDLKIISNQNVNTYGWDIEEVVDKSFFCVFPFIGTKSNNKKDEYKTIGSKIEFYFDEFKETTENPEKVKKDKVRNIILIGGVGSGKSAIANVLVGENKFEEIPGGSIFKDSYELTWEEFVYKDKKEENEIKCRLCEIPDFLENKIPEETRNDIQSNFEEILAAGNINQIFLIYQNRNEVNDKIIPYYNYLVSKGVPLEHLTAVRTNYPSFENEERTNEDRKKVRENSEEWEKVFSSVPTIYIDNPPLEGMMAEKGKEVRKTSREKLLEYLATKNKLSEPILPKKTIEIPLDTVTGRSDWGGQPIYNEGKNESIFVTGDLANPFECKINKIDQIWIRADKHIAEYGITPQPINITDTSGRHRTIEVIGIRFPYRINNFNLRNVEVKKREEAKPNQIRIEIPNFVDESKTKGDRMIGESLIIKEGSQVRVHLSGDNRKTKTNEKGEEYAKWKNWGLEGEDGKYTLEFYDDYTLEVENDGELSFNFKFDKNSLKSLISKALSAKWGDDDHPLDFKDLIEKIRNHSEYPDLPPEQKHEEELARIELELFAKWHKKRLRRLFADEETRKLWESWLNKLKEETKWLETDENAVEYLKRLADNGYLPTDADRLKFRQQVEGELKSCLVDYSLNNSKSLSAFDWKKEKIELFIKYVSPLETLLNNEATAPINSEHWRKKLSKTVVAETGTEWEVPTGANVIQKLENLVKNFSGANDELEKILEKIENCSLRELYYIFSNEGNSYYKDEQVWNKWDDTIIIPADRERIFYCPDLANNELEQCQEILTAIQNLLSQKERNIDKVFLTKNKHLTNPVKRISSEPRLRKLRDIINNGSHLLDKTFFANGYFNYYNIGELEPNQIGIARFFYQHLENRKSETDFAMIEQVVLKNIHGEENWEAEITKKQQQVFALYTLSEWNKETGILNNLNSLTGNEEQKNRVKTELEKCPLEIWNWAAEKTKVSEKYQKLRAAAGLRKGLNVLLDEAEKETDYHKLNGIWKEILAWDREKKIEGKLFERTRAINKKVDEVGLEYAFDQAAVSNKVDDLKYYYQEINLYKQSFSEKKEDWKSIVWEEKNVGYVPPSPGNIFGIGKNNGTPGSLDIKLAQLDKKITDLENWEQSANDGLAELENRAKNDIWLSEELNAFEEEIKKYPPSPYKAEEEPTYYRGFHQVYRAKKTTADKLIEIKNIAEKNVKDYTELNKKIDNILRKTRLSYEIPSSTASTPTLDLEAIKADIKELRDVTPDGNTGKNWNGGVLLPIHEKVYFHESRLYKDYKEYGRLTDEEGDKFDWKNEIIECFEALESMLEKEKKELKRAAAQAQIQKYLAEHGEVLNEWEKKVLEKAVKTKEVNEIIKWLEKWRNETLPKTDKEVRGVWQNFIASSNTDWVNTKEEENEFLENLKKLAEKNWDQYFVSQRQLKNLNLKEWSLTHYVSPITGIRTAEKINCLTTDYQNLDWELEKKMFLALDFNGRAWELSDKEQNIPVNSIDGISINSVAKLRLAHELLTVFHAINGGVAVDSWDLNHLEKYDPNHYNFIKKFHDSKPDNENYHSVRTIFEHLFSEIIEKTVVKYETLRGWDDFFAENGIEETDTENRKLWQKCSNAAAAQEVYKNAYKNDDEGNPYEKGLTEEQQKQFEEEIKKNIDSAKNPAEIEKAQTEIKWGLFFNLRNITSAGEQKDWAEKSGLKVSEARISYDENEWHKIIGDNTITIELKKDKKISFTLKGQKINEAYLVNHSWKETEKSLILLKQITTQTDFNNLPTGEEIENKFSSSIDNNKVPNELRLDKIKEALNDKKFELFKKNFESGGDSGLTDDQIKKWMNADTGLGGDGVNERIAFNNGWTDPKKIVSPSVGFATTYSYQRYDIFSIENLRPSFILVDVKKVNKTTLDSVKKIINDIVDAALNDLPEKYSGFKAGTIETLPDNDTLPENYRKTDIINLYDNHRQWLINNEFIKAFIDAGGTAYTFANDFGRRNDVLAYRKKCVDFISGNEWEISGTEAVQIFNNEWLSTEINFDSIKGITAVYGGRDDWNPLNTPKREAEKEVWIANFEGKFPSGLNKTEILDYRKHIITFATPVIPATVAREVCQHHWKSSQFKWDGTTALIESYHPDLNGMDAAKIDREEWEKVIDIENRIKGATDLANLIPESEIIKYKKSKVPTVKNYTYIKNLYKDKKADLTQKEKDKNDRQSAIQAVENHWTSLNMSGQIENVCGANWKTDFGSKSGTEITNYENSLKNLINQAKIQPDISEIETELNKKPTISSSELKNSDYRAEMLSLITNDTKRTNRKDEIIAEIKQIRTNKLEAVRQIITQATTIKDKDGATKEELEKVINDLKTLAKAVADSAEQIVWEENKDTNQKLLTDLEGKLSKNYPPAPKEPDKKGPKIPKPTEDVPPPAPNQPLTEPQKEVYGEDYQQLETLQQTKRQEVVKNWKENKENIQARKSACQSCKKEFSWDKNLNYLAAKKKVESELQAHQSTCSLKNKPESKSQLQAQWEAERNSKSRSFFSCPKCWEKVELDKSIKDYSEAKKQALADLLKHHQENCNAACLFANNSQDHHQHAPLTLLNKQEQFINSLFLEMDENGIAFHQPTQENSQGKGTDWTLWIIIGGVWIVLAAGIFWVFYRRRKSNKSEE